MDSPRLLLVDDDRHLLESMAGWLRERGYPTDTATGQEEALRQIGRTTYDVVLADIRLRDGDGFTILSHCRENAPSTTVILITGFGTVDMAIEAIRAGAFDFLTKPLIDEELEMAIQRAVSQRQVIEENRNLKAQLNERFSIDNIVGRDHRMLRVFDLVRSVADTRTTVLITGESGTGKSMIARAVHRYSARRDKPFVEVACGALPESLLESELFGHVAGAFTGAAGNRAGKFLQADGGTIFLDEIATASPSMQVKLLRVLQDFEFEPVGGTETHRVDTRVILATNENLDQLVAEGKFRQDLYYRINVIDVTLPSLRDRISDIPLLAETFLEKVCRESGKQVSGFTDDAMAAMQGHNWPGNVRELQNVVERAVLLGKGTTICRDDLPAEMFHAAPYVPFAQTAGQRTLKEALEEPERRIILEVLEGNDWNRHATADALGINRTTLYKKMKRLGLE
ncbi:MAG: sigma-54-dependent Fis family transcriptional regulator, partial [Planctomycetales bacterium]|nr:sigma-54-dependent Fis family transcriptional regulator [Planctomycetales bacterium]